MSAIFFNRYFNDLSAFCIPKGASKLFEDSSTRENALRYEKVKWIDLTNDQKTEFLMVLIGRPGRLSMDDDVWLKRSISALLTCVNYLLQKNGGNITWSELFEFFRLTEINKAWESEDDASAKMMLYEFLTDIPGWPHNLNRSYEQFGYMSINVHSNLEKMGRLSRRGVDDLALYLGGSRCLGGDARLSRTIGHMFTEVSSFNCLREPIINLVRDRFDQKLLMKTLPSWAKGKILEDDLGM